MNEPATTPIEALRSARYISLTTYRKNGEAVSTPIWFAVDGDRLVAFTGAQTGKVRRIRATGEVAIAACTAMGKIKGPSFAAEAAVVSPDQTDHVMSLIRRKYRVTKFLLDATVGTIRLVRRKPQTHSVCLEFRFA